MSFFENIFHKNKKGESVILIDIGASSIAGAYVRYEEGEVPTPLYTRTVPIEIRMSERRELSMLRALTALGTTLIREGAPVLTRATGSGRVDIILVSVDAPWQETSVRTEQFEEKEPFEFTKSVITKRLEETNVASSEKMIADESIIGTILNGYETRNPYGKKASRASVIVLTSLIERNAANSIVTELRSLFHTTRILPIAGSSIRYQAMRLVFPHEANAIILDATGGLVSVSLVRKGLFSTLVQIQTPPENRDWLTLVTSELTEISKNFPLPRTIFLLAREPEIFTLRKELESADFGPLWLSDNPPKIVSVLKNHLASSVRHMATDPADIVLLLMTLYFQNRRSSPNDIG